MSKELVKKSELLKEYARQSKEFGGRDVDLEKGRTVGNNGYVINQSFELDGTIKNVPVYDADGKQTEVFIGLGTTSGTDLSLKALMGMTSLRGYTLSGEIEDSSKTVHKAEVAEGIDSNFVGWPALPSRDLYEVAAQIEAGEFKVKGMTATFKGTAFRPFKAKKAGKDLVTGTNYKKDDQRAADVKLWEVA